MVKIRLRRMGAKKKPQYRLVVADSRSPRDGAFIETIGHYDPRTKPATVVIKEERVRLWLSRGAQPTETVARLLSRVNLSAEGEVASKASPAQEVTIQETTGEVVEPADG